MIEYEIDLKLYMKPIEEVEAEIDQEINRKRYFFQDGRKNLQEFIRINGLWKQ